MKKKFCVKTPTGGGDCFGFETKKERIAAAHIAADQANKSPGSKVFECQGDKCVLKGTSGGDLPWWPLFAMMGLFGATLIHMRKNQ